MMVGNVLASGGPGSEVAASNQLHVSWNNSTVSANVLSPENILEYFCNPSNPFYERTNCNNEELRMQRLTIERLSSMQGIQYVLHRAAEPLFVIRKHLRHSPTSVTPMADYYIIAGVVYQAPNLSAVISSRVLAATHSIRESFLEALKCSNYHPSKGYSWEFTKSNNRIAAKMQEKSGEEKSKTSSSMETRTTLFQRERTDRLLGLLSDQFPLSWNPTVPVAEKPVMDTLDEVRSEAGSTSQAEGGAVASGTGGVKRDRISELKSGLTADSGPASKRPKTEVA